MQLVEGVRYRLFNGIITEPMKTCTGSSRIWKFMGDFTENGSCITFPWNEDGIVFDGRMSIFIPDYNVKEVYVEEKIEKPVKHMDQMTLADWQKNIDRMWDSYKLY